MRGDARRYWRRVQGITAGLLLIWFVVSFVVSYFARDLNRSFFGWPFSYWMAAQGALIVYGFIIAIYAWYVNRLDDRYGVVDPPDAEEPHGP